MKRKILALIAVLAMVLSMSGCSTEGTQFLGKMKEVCAWEAANIKGSMGMEMEVGGTKLKANVDVEGYIVQKLMQGEMTMTIKNLEFNNSKQSYKVTLSPVKIYIDGMKYYMSTSFLKELAAFAGEEGVNEIGKVIDLDKDYIAMDMTSTFKELGISSDDIYKMSTGCYAEMGDLKKEVPVTKDGDQYSLSLNEEQLVNAVCSLAVHFLDSKEDKAGIAAFFKEMEMVETDEEAALPGTTTKLSFVFGKDSCNADMDVNLGFSAFTEKGTMKLKVSMASQKADKKAITMPASAAAYDCLEFVPSALSMLLQPAEVSISKADTITRNGKTYVPVKEAAEAAGLTVGYDKTAKSAYVEFQGQKVPVQSAAINGKSYMSLVTAKELGINIMIK